MNPSPIISALLLPLVLLTFSIAADAGRLDEVCRAANASLGADRTDYDTCMEVLRADPRSETADFRELGMISAQLCLANATDAVVKVSDMIRRGNYNGKTKECLGRCARNVYKPQIKDLIAAIDQYTSGNYGGAANIIDTVQATAADCYYIFYDCPGFDPTASDPSDLRLFAILASFIIRHFGLK